MWNTQSLWFDVTIVSIGFAVGNIIFGHFEERTPKWRRIGKYILTLIFFVSTSYYFSRVTAVTILVLFIPLILYIHAYYLPRKKGINGWTGEPKSKYYDFRGWNKDIFKEK